MEIYHSKTWKHLCDKTPTEEQIGFFNEILKKHKMRNHHIRILANFCKYDVEGDWVDRFFKVLDFVKEKGNVQTLEASLLKYGEKHGQLIYKEVNSKKTNNLEAFIKRCGEIEGKKRYDAFCRNNVGNKTIERFIQLYGLEEGTSRFNECRNKEKTKGTLNYWIEKYGEIEGQKKYTESLKKLHYGNSKESYIKKYGEKEGSRLFKESRDNTSLSSFIKRHGEIEGNRKFNEFRERVKKNNTLEGYVERYGEIEGKIKFEKWATTSSIGVTAYSKVSQELFVEIDVIGENTYYATKNKEFGRYSPFGYYFFDYVNTDRKKIIEFNGDIFHGNPIIFSKNDTPNPFDKKLTCEQMWKNDKKKIDFIIQEGFEVLTIWEKDYRLDKNEIIEKCKKFLYGG
jgi:G:T-mismatch repair DNA endonuclease (very short patch repair protein)